jgi:glycosyltransferase involved in cell wall biosynthesis
LLDNGFDSPAIRGVIFTYVKDVHPICGAKTYQLFRASTLSCLSFGLPASDGAGFRAARRIAGPYFDAHWSRVHYGSGRAMQRALNVLHVYSGNLFGGVERMLISLATMHASEYRSHFALCFEGKLSRALQAKGAPVTFLGPVRLRNPLSALRARRALRRLLSARGFDAVVCHSIWTHCIFAPVLTQAGRAPILYLHDIPDPNGAFYRWAWRRPPALGIANSATTAQPLAQMRSPIPVRIVHPLVDQPPSPDITAIRQLRAHWGANPEDVVILQASRFDAWKGHRNLLEALAAMHDVPGWRCWIAGAPQRPEEETYKQELMRRVESLALSQRVSFIGHRDDMDTVLAACDVYCQPNETPEPFGMVFVEAMYAGKPVVGRALGGAAEIVTPDCGILCPPGAEPLTAALRSLVGSSQIREQMSMAGPARAAKLCGPEPFRAQFSAALESVRARPRRAVR